MKRAPPETDGARNWIYNKTEPQSLSSSFDRRSQPVTQLPSISWRSIGVIEVVLGSLRSPTEAEQCELRAMWWRQRRLGFTFPAQRGVIVIDGGRP